MPQNLQSRTPKPIDQTTRGQKMKDRTAAPRSDTWCHLLSRGRATSVRAVAGNIQKHWDMGSNFFASKMVPAMRRARKWLRNVLPSAVGFQLLNTRRGGLVSSSYFFSDKNHQFLGAELRRVDICNRRRIQFCVDSAYFQLLTRSRSKVMARNS